MTRRSRTLARHPFVPTPALDACTAPFQLSLCEPSCSQLLQRTSQPAEPRYVRRVEEYLVARLQEPIRMAELSALTGVSVRSIQEGFQKHRGQPPLAFLRLLRLTKARALLSQGDCSVTGVALACGFEHLGRFSVQYRAFFGESPSRTLAEACARRAGPVPE